MICKNCGAEYSDGNLQCPYCHSENKKMAARRKKEVLKSYDEEAEKIKELAKQYPRKTVNRWTKYIFVGVGIFVAAGLVITLVAILVNRVSSSYEYHRMQNHIMKLEEMFLAGDYAGIDAYMQKEELYGYEYEKYWQVKDAYTQCADIEESVACIVALEGDICKVRNEWEAYIEHDIRKILKGTETLLFYYEEECRDDVFRGNEEVLEMLCEQGLSMVEEFGFSEEEMREIKLGSESTQREVLFQKLEDYFWNKSK